MRHGSSTVNFARGEADWARSYAENFDIPSMFPNVGSNIQLHFTGPCFDTDLKKFLNELSSKLVLSANGPLNQPTGDIPAGYTYLLQLIFHDLTNSRIVYKGRSPKPFNINTPTLDLDTLYGGGPLHQPLIYQTPLGDDNQRYLFRIGTHRGSDVVPLPEQTIFPFDLARTCGNAVDMRGLQTPNEPLIADQRNDDHSILSQLIVLFKVVHNNVASALRESGKPADVAFGQAKAFLTAAYKNIILKDVLKRLVDPAVYSYAFDDQQQRDWGNGDCSQVTKEFVFGVSRFGHSMVRSTYQINTGPNADEIGQILLRSSLRDEPASNRTLPLTNPWLVDWNLFFKTEHRKANLARRISPMHGTMFAAERFRDAVCRGDGKKSIVQLDIDRAIRLALPTGQQIAEKLQSSIGPFEILTGDRMKASTIKVYDDFSYAQDVLAELDRYISKSKFKALFDHTPLNYYVLQEAAVLGENGSRLGPVGSYILTRTIAPLLTNMDALENQSLENMVDLLALTKSTTAELLALFDKGIGRQRGIKKYARLNEVGE